MNDRRQIITRRAARGFTLIEVLLVLTLMCIIAAIVWPSLQRPFAGRRLQSAADAVRAQWCQARVAAMRSGRTFVFRYTVGGDQFRVEPQDDPSAPDSSFSAATGMSTTGEGALGTLGETLRHEEGTLPDGIRFLADNTAGNDLADLSSDQQTDSQVGGSGDWSAPILFYPDGTTSNARLVLADDRNYGIRLMLRGLTGTVTVSDITSLVE